jgi:hypothetical protein
MTKVIGKHQGGIMSQGEKNKIVEDYKNKLVFTLNESTSKSISL